MSRRRIGVIYPWANLDGMPSMVGMIELLAASGFEIDVFVVESAAFQVAFFQNPRIHVRLHSEDSLYPGVITSTLRRTLRRASVKDGLRFFKAGRELIRTLKIVRKNHHNHGYLCFIAVDPEGLIRSRDFCLAAKVPVIYYSLELLITKELSSRHEMAMKRHEKCLSQSAAFVVIQDQQRAQILAAENDLALDKLVLVPNAPLGNARRRKSDYWQRRLGIRPERRIVLSSGSLAPWTGIEDIIQSVSSWPSDCVLVLQSRCSMTADEIQYFRRLAGDPHRIFFSTEPVSRQEYNELVDGADVGIAFYNPTPGSRYTMGNVENIGLSSGKVAYYLRGGLPVVVNSRTNLGSFIHNENCGATVEDGGGVARALEQIFLDYSEFSQRACQVFDRSFHFSNHFESLLERIKALQT